jgi:cell division septum initiation protein DivIVA
MLVDRLEAIINGGFRPPLTSKVMVDEREVLDVLDLMRTAIPEEIKQSRRVTQEREKILADAQAEANRLLAQAQERLELMLQEDNVVAAAEERAQQIETEAHARADEIRIEADQYALDVLRELNDHLARIENEVRNGIQALTRRLQVQQPELVETSDQESHS